jgi:hypothetical protein
VSKLTDDGSTANNVVVISPVTELDLFWQLANGGNLYAPGGGPASVLGDKILLQDGDRSAQYIIIKA